MRTSHLVVVALLLVALGAVAWPARAGDERSVAERLLALEERVEGLERRWNDLGQILSGQMPNLLAVSLKANETAAQATLRNIISAQAQFQQSAKTDEDNDGVGEYGGFIELSGAAPGRMGWVLVPPVLSGAFRILDAEGGASRSGYFFRMYLCGKGGLGVGEPQAGYAKGRLDAEASETAWCCYAWPVEHGTSGRRTFFTNQAGDVLATEAASYSGAGKGPMADAAFAAPGPITGKVAAGAKGADHNTWQGTD